MEDALWAQLQNSQLHDDQDEKRVESETDEEEEQEQDSVSLRFLVLPPFCNQI